MIGETPLTTRVKLFKEFDVEFRLQGTSGFLTLLMPLHVGEM